MKALSYENSIWPVNGKGSHPIFLPELLASKKKGNSMPNPFVAYFSASGITEGLAAELARALQAPLYEIHPAQPYTKADLDWTNPNSRSSVEMRNLASRPAIGGKLPDLKDYNPIFVGFPIWWYTAPTIINTFLEHYSLQEKIIVPFATSGGSPMGKSSQDLQKSAPGAIVEAGRRFAPSASEAALQEWAASYLEKA